MLDHDVRILTKLAADSGLAIVDECTLPGKEAEYDTIPSELSRQIKDLLQEKYPQGLYKFQSRAIREALFGT